MVAVGFNPRTMSFEPRVRRVATIEIMADFQVSHRAPSASVATRRVGIWGIVNRGLKPTATIVPSLRDAMRSRPMVSSLAMGWEFSSRCVGGDERTGTKIKNGPLHPLPRFLTCPGWGYTAPGCRCYSFNPEPAATVAPPANPSPLAPG